MFFSPNQSNAKKVVLLFQQMTKNNFCVRNSDLRTYVNSDWMLKPKNAIRIYAKYTQETIFLKYEVVSTQMSGMWAGLVRT